MNTTTQTRTRPRETSPDRKPKKVTLVVEHYLDSEEQRSLSELTRLLDPQNTELSVVHALSDILTDLPASSEDLKGFGKNIRAREQHHEQICQDMNRELTGASFEIAHEQRCNMQEACARQIVDHVTQTGQDLLVVCGSHPPKDAFSRSHFSMTLATHAPVSVLLLRKPLGNPQGKLKVLLGVDSSDASMDAARKLGQLLRPEQMTLTVTTVQSAIYQENAVLAPFVNGEVLEQALEANARMVFEMVDDILATQGLTVQEHKKLIGSPATELGYLAEVEHPDLVVVGSHNKKGFLAWLTGSVSSQLLHWDTHNMLVVR